MSGGKIQAEFPEDKWTVGHMSAAVGECGADSHQTVRAEEKYAVAEGKYVKC